MSKENWDKIFSENREFSSLNEIFLDKLLSRIGETAGKEFKTVIDLGAGTGDSTIKFANHGFLVQGIDWSEVALAKAACKIKKLGLEERISLTKMDLDNINQGQIIYRPVDILFSKLTHAFIKNKDKLLDGIKSLMSAESVFILITPIIYKGIKYDQGDKPEIAVDWDETLKLLNEKFTQIEVFHHDYFGERGDLVTFIATK